jgi:hypothetical protein
MMPGPPRKRTEERQGHAHGPKAQEQTDKVIDESELVLPDPNPTWVPIALYAWESYLTSPIKAFLTATDYAFAWAACDALDTAVKRGTATSWQAAETLMRSALFNEAERRKARIEVTRKAPAQNPRITKNQDDLQARRAARDAV